AARIADESRPGAIAAVGGAAIRNKEEHAVRISMDESWNWRMGVLTARVAHFPRRGLSFFDPRDHLAPDRPTFVICVDEIEKIGSDRESQFRLAGQFRSEAFCLRQSGQ